MTPRDGQIADQAQRDRALDPTRSFIVQAPAGAGKTELLIQRYLRLLDCVDEPEAILAITFTRKAAAEMQGRVLAALHQAATETRPEEPHKALTWDLARKALERDAQRGWGLLSNPSRIRIQTIDSLCASITANMPWISGFGAQPAIAEEPGDLYIEAARNTLKLAGANQPWSPAIESLLLHLDNDCAKAEELLTGMLQKRDQWLRIVMSQEGRSRAALEETLRGIICDALADLRALTPNAIIPELPEFARHAAENLAGRNKPVVACKDLQALPGCEPEDLPQWLGLANMLLTNEGNLRSRLNRLDGFPCDGDRDRKIRDRCQKMVASLASEEAFCHALHGLRTLPPARFTDQQWAALEALLTVLPVAVAQLRMVFSARGQVDFAEVALRAIDALGEPDQPTDLAFALDCRIQHILVDEFQDTSITQYVLLEKLTSEWTPGDGRTLFLVGDPMQSIYRFREAEVGLFLRAQTSGIGHVLLERLTLSVNFRSDQSIVDWVNAAFAEIFPHADDIATGAVRYTASRSSRSSVGRTPSSAPDPRVRLCPTVSDGVTVHPLFQLPGGPDANEQEAETVIDLVRTSQAHNPAGKTAILVRARTHLPAIIARLKSAGLRFRAVDIDELGERWIIQDLLALTRALVHAADRLSWLGVLRARWCGLSLPDLHAIASADLERCVYEALRDESIVSRLSAGGQQRVRRVREILSARLAERGRMPLRRFVEGAWIALGGPACLDNSADVEDALTFFDLLETLDSGGDVEDLAKLEEAVSSLFANPDPEAGDSLQVMTIHKAKGLEFDTVLIPGLGRQPRHDSPQLLRWLVRPTRRSEAELLIAPITETGADNDPIYSYLQTIERAKQDNEDVRLLYVAATRAKTRLHLLGCVKAEDKGGALEMGKPAGNSLLAKLWPVLEGRFAEAFAGAQSAAPAGESAAGPVPLTIRSLPADWQIPALPCDVPWAAAESAAAEPDHVSIRFDWAGVTARHVGTVTHEYLQRIAAQGLAEWRAERVEAERDAIEIRLRSLGVPNSSLDAASGLVREALRSTLSDPRGRWILHAHTDARSEYSLTGITPNGVRQIGIDRTFIDQDGTRWIIDFKIGAHEGGKLEEFLDRERERYREQLELYASLMANIDPRPIRLALYFPLLKGWREWAPGSGAHCAAEVSARRE